MGRISDAEELDDVAVWVSVVGQDRNRRHPVLGHPGGVVLRPLPADAEVVLRLDGRVAGRARTLRPPPGRPLARIATLSDLHIGERSFGYLPTLRDAPEDEGHPLTCLRAAVAAIRAWGPDLVVVKGDLGHRCEDAEYDAAGAVLRTIGAPMVVVPGNHDGGNHAGADVAAALARNGLTLTTGVATVDLPGLRVVAASSLVEGKGHGVMSPVLSDAADALRGAPGGALLANIVSVVLLVIETVSFHRG